MSEQRILERRRQKRGDSNHASTNASRLAYFGRADPSNRLFLGLLFGALISVVLWAVIFALGWAFEAMALGVVLCVAVMVARLFRLNGNAED